MFLKGIFVIYYILVLFSCVLGLIVAYILSLVTFALFENNKKDFYRGFLSLTRVFHVYLVFRILPFQYGMRAWWQRITLAVIDENQWMENPIMESMTVDDVISTAASGSLARVANVI